MNSRILRGAGAGIAGGVVFGAIMQMMKAPSPEGGSLPMMQMVAMVVRSDSLAIGWIYHLFNSAVIGGLFGALFGGRIHDYYGGLSYGGFWGFVWWILGGLILMPLLLGMPAFAPLRMAPMLPVAVGSLVGHLVYGFILGVAYVRLARPMSLKSLGPLAR